MWSRPRWRIANQHGLAVVMPIAVFFARRGHDVYRDP